MGDAEAGEGVSVVVVGMHRSGTSMVAMVLRALGIGMGRELLGALPSNPLGHFEDVEFVELNQTILEAAGGSWDDPPPRDAILAAGEEAGERIREAVRRRQRDATLWGFKDPRTSLLLELYLPLLSGPRVVACRRDPDAVVASLAERDGIAEPRARELVDRYRDRLEEARRRVPEVPWLEVVYEDAVADRWGTARELAAFTGVEAGWWRCFRAARKIASPRRLRWNARWLRFKEWLRAWSPASGRRPFSKAETHDG